MHACLQLQYDTLHKYICIYYLFFFFLGSVSGLLIWSVFIIIFFTCGNSSVI